MAHRNNPVSSPIHAVRGEASSSCEPRYGVSMKVALCLSTSPRRLGADRSCASRAEPEPEVKLDSVQIELVEVCVELLAGIGLVEELGQCSVVARLECQIHAAKQKLVTGSSRYTEDQQVVGVFADAVYLFAVNSRVYDDRTARVLWIGIIAGRLVVVHLSRRYAAQTLLAWGSLTAGVVLGLGFLVATPQSIAAACLLAGFFTGAVVPLLVAVACAWRPRSSGSASALVFLNASLSRTLFPWLIGLIAQTAGFQAAMSLTWAPLIVAGALALFMPKDAGAARAR